MRTLGHHRQGQPVHYLPPATSSAASGSFHATVGFSPKRPLRSPWGSRVTELWRTVGRSATSRGDGRRFNYEILCHRRPDSRYDHCPFSRRDRNIVPPETADMKRATDARTIAPPRANLDANLLARYGRPGPRYTSYPIAVEFSQDFSGGDYLQRLQSLSVDDEISLYIHVETRFGLDFAETFAVELAELADGPVQDGLVNITRSAIEVTDGDNCSCAMSTCLSIATDARRHVVSRPSHARCRARAA